MTHNGTLPSSRQGPSAGDDDFFDDVTAETEAMLLAASQGWEASHDVDGTPKKDKKAAGSERDDVGGSRVKAEDEDDDEYGMGDEALLLAASQGWEADHEADGTPKKRKAENEYGGEGQRNEKKLRLEEETDGEEEGGIGTGQAGSRESIELANRVVKQYFKLPGFRLKQEAAIARLLDGESATVIFPTGGGKSLCYQVPAVAFKVQDEEQGTRSRQMGGITLVISPLIALMKDQVDALRKKGIKAAVLNSAQTRDEFLAVQEGLRSGDLDLLYCAPERLNNEGFIGSLKAIPGGIRLLAIDEAHCISEWGHSFRPDYLKIARFAKEARVERVVCLTATATPKVASDVCEAFAIPEQEGLFRTTVYRPNLTLRARTVLKGSDYVGDLVDHLKAHPGPTIVYVTVQKVAESLTEELKKRGFPAKAYHAGMVTDVKTKTQDEFLASKKMIVVATIAFGMGIDKPNIRNVIHYDIPSSIEAYSQQIGRAGRDGLKSVCMFNLGTKDFHLRNIFTYGDRPSKRSLRVLLAQLCSAENRRLKIGDTFEVSHWHQARDTDIGAITLSIIYTQLELHYGLIRAAGAVYSEYKYIPKRSELIKADKSKAAVAILRHSKKAKTWTALDLFNASAMSGLPRTDLVRKVDEWNEKGYIELKKEGVQQKYRLEKVLPKTAKEIEAIVTKLDEDMEYKENQDLERTKALIKMITDKRCFSRSLAEYFGETSDISKGCGHCTWCETKVQVHLPDDAPLALDPRIVERVLAKVDVRDDPRFLAKVAFGIKSPRVSEMKLTGAAGAGVFESMTECDFQELLKVFTEECVKSGKYQP